MKAIGVREITNFIDGKVSLDEAKKHNEEKHEKLYQKTRYLDKR